MSQSASRLATGEFVLVGNPGGRRVALLQGALAGLGRPPAQVLAYADLLAGRVELAQAVRPGAVVRIESPGQDFEVERALLGLGAAAAEAEGSPCLSRAALERLSFERGRWLPLRQWYLGFCTALALIERQLADCPPHQLMAAPSAIATMFDKRACHALLRAAGVAVPRALGPVGSHAELVARMRADNCPRVFIKPAHGSSAAGVVAYQLGRDRQQATTTAEMQRAGGELRLYSSRRIRTYRDPSDIGTLIDALCRERVHVERWLPKAGFGGQVFDLRVVVIGGRARHVVARMSRTPLTNLHLLNGRGDLPAILERIGPDAWESARRTCEAAMRCFPASRYAGIDLLISSDYRRHAVLEVNAFGDLLPGVLYEGLDTYAAEVCEILEIRD